MAELHVYDANGAEQVTVSTVAASAITGQVATANGGTGQDLSGSTGDLVVDAGVVSANSRTGTGDSVRSSAPTVTSPVINTGVSGTAIDDDGTLASPSTTKVPTTNAVNIQISQYGKYKAMVDLATDAALAANIYNNGSSGVGATLTANANGAMASVDGVTPTAGMRILVKDESDLTHLGIYTVTQVGSAGTPYILTRATDFDVSDKVVKTSIPVRLGTKNKGKIYSVLNTAAITFGSSNIFIEAYATSSVGENVYSGLNDFRGATLKVPTTTPAAEEEIGWNTTDKYLTGHDGTQARGLSPVGFMPFKAAESWSPTNTYGGTISLAAVSGTMLVPIWLPATMRLVSVSILNQDTATQRSWRWDLYIDRANASNTVNRIATANAIDTFTPSGAAQTRTSAASAVTDLPPGMYWLAIQNVHATSTFGVGINSLASSFARVTAKTKTTGSTNGATLDIIAATWTGIQAAVAYTLNGSVAGDSSAW